MNDFFIIISIHDNGNKDMLDGWQKDSRRKANGWQEDIRWTNLPSLCHPFAIPSPTVCYPFTIRLLSHPSAFCSWLSPGSSLISRRVDRDNVTGNFGKLDDSDYIHLLNGFVNNIFRNCKENYLFYIYIN